MIISYGMEYRVRVTVGAKKESIEIAKDERLIVAVRAPRKSGKANERMRELLALHFRVALDDVTILSGHSRSTKRVAIRGDH